MFALDHDGVLRTQRLALRPLTPADKKDLLRTFTWNVVRWLSSTPWPYTAADADEWLAMQGPWNPCGDAARLAVTRNGDFMGAVTLTVEPKSEKQSGDGPMLGYWLAEDFWGHGYVTEAARAMIDRTFEETTWPAIYSGALSDNGRSRRALEKLGFVHDGPEGEIFSHPRSCMHPHITVILTRKRWSNWSNLRAAHRSGHA
jgi:RimJ/RimL family protein N-acetyltransferase